ncbi:hypothetical protein [Rhizorhabdus dicambivorans]|uniref:Uncharacterized protein n=1 Tax=Rhizorhabdus dicambivorans TaxID=1850238 RepID=A0A2A4FNJ9_9SPHN|nr:hypothetical protein [Rhizorhabdus dicambivorans]ATE65259.1 hypothetical protein CMV14_13285 [Rhizorhabdus dicambivorans]PCE39669.1 hypothetical protein COO09_24340 [Rhizorhabdus dicambivorans]
MPRSRGRRKKPGKTHQIRRSAGPVFQLLPVPTNRDMFRERMSQAAEAHVARLPKMFAAFQQLFRDHDPAGLIASVAYYGLQRGIREDGSTTPISSKLEQHHVELLQAVLLTLPYEEWPAAPSLPRAIDRVFNELPELSLAFLAQRIVAGKEIDDIQTRTIAALQERIRLHTHAVRNWGYFGDVVSITREIYSPLDTAFLAHHGFAASDVIELARAMVAEIERRSNAWFSALRPVANAKTIPEMLQRYYAGFPDLAGSAEGLAERIPKEARREQVLAMLMGHADLRHPENATFDATSLAALTGLDAGRVEKTLRAIALRPGSLAGQKLEFLFLANPVWLAPLIDLGGSFLAPMPQIVMSHIHAILRRLADEAGALEPLDTARNAYLERRMVEALSAALPMASVRSSVTWSFNGQRFETDAIAQTDKLLLIAEAKANHLTPQGLRGAPDRVKRHVRDMVVEPSLQSARLEAIVRQAQAGSSDALATLAEAGINEPGQIERIIRLSVSLDDLSVLASAEQELRDAGWVPADHELAPMMNIADLLAVADILDRPVVFLHYLAERGPFQRAFELFGDELDFLGLYLQTGFNLGGVPQDMRLVPSGMSEAIDRYYDARDAGKLISKPRPRLSTYFLSILDTLALRQPSGWTLIGMHLLNAADQDEQARLARMLERARKKVRRKTTGMEDGAVVSLKPPLERKASVAFYIHDHADRAALKQSVEEVASKELDAVAECVVFARHIDRWDEPYQIAAIAKALS